MASTEAVKRASKAYRSRLKRLGYVTYLRRVPREFVAKLDELLNKLKEDRRGND